MPKKGYPPAPAGEIATWSSDEEEAAPQLPALKGKLAQRNKVDYSKLNQMATAGGPNQHKPPQSSPKMQ